MRNSQPFLAIGTSRNKLLIKKLDLIGFKSGLKLSISSHLLLVFKHRKKSFPVMLD